jgi:hypothetical protein
VAFFSGLRDLPDGVNSVDSYSKFTVILQYIAASRFDMATALPASSHQDSLKSWRELYTAALFETDQNRIPERIAQAEKAIVARARELFSASADTIEEDQALDDALYALRALQNCLQVHASAA